MKNKYIIHKSKGSDTSAYPSILGAERPMRSHNVGLKVTGHWRVGMWGDAVLLKVGRYGKREKQW